MTNNTTEGLYIGKPEAEAETVGENALFHCTFRVPNILSLYLRNS